MNKKQHARNKNDRLATQWYTANARYKTSIGIPYSFFVWRANLPDAKREAMRNKANWLIATGGVYSKEQVDG